MVRPVIEDIDEYRKHKRGCYLRLIASWFGLMFLIIAVMLFVRDRTLRNDPEAVQAELFQQLVFTPPEGFFAYSRTKLAGASVYAWWSEQHIGEDGRNTSVISFYSKQSWSSRELGSVREEVLNKMEGLLDDSEFRTRAQASIPFEIDGVKHTIYQYSGLQKMDYGMFEATSCFLFVQTPMGPIQIQTIGLDQTFAADAQIACLKSVRPQPLNAGE